MRALYGASFPTIILTGDVLRETLQRIASAGAVHRNKPVSMRDLFGNNPDLAIAAPGFPAAAFPSEKAVTRKHGHIRIVDDDPQVRESLCAALRFGGGWQRRVSRPAKRLMASAELAAGDCLLLDAYLPGMSGSIAGSAPGCGQYDPGHHDHRALGCDNCGRRHEGRSILISSRSPSISPICWPALSARGRWSGKRASIMTDGWPLKRRWQSSRLDSGRSWPACWMDSPARISLQIFRSASARWRTIVRQSCGEQARRRSRVSPGSISWQAASIEIWSDHRLGSFRTCPRTPSHARIPAWLYPQPGDMA